MDQRITHKIWDVANACCVLRVACVRRACCVRIATYSVACLTDLCLHNLCIRVFARGEG